MKKRFNKPVKYVVYSHGHFDHIGGGQVFQKDGATVVAHENAVEPLIGEKLPTAVPDRTFKKDLTLELGSEKVVLTFVAPNHSNSMILIHFPKPRAMMAVDFCPVGALPYNEPLPLKYILPPVRSKATPPGVLSPLMRDRGRRSLRPRHQEGSRHQHRVHAEPA